VCPRGSKIKNYPTDPSAEFTLDFTDHIVLQASRWESKTGKEGDESEEQNTYRFILYDDILGGTIPKKFEKLMEPEFFGEGTDKSFTKHLKYYHHETLLNSKAPKDTLLTKGPCYKNIVKV
jgi:hypothetical protein